VQQNSNNNKYNSRNANRRAAAITAKVQQNSSNNKYNSKNANKRAAAITAKMQTKEQQQ
jgi:hypothetical protein